MPTFPSRARWVLPCCWLLALAGLALPARAQTPPPRTDPGALPNPTLLVLEQLRRTAPDRTSALVLEGVVDPETYIVGPGDVFSVAYGGVLANETLAQVSADGVLVIPEAGAFAVAGLTLVEARARVQAGLRRVYRNVETQVALARPRQFLVHVSGAVPRPGRHALGPVARVEDAVEAALGEAPEARLALALRNVEVRRADGTRLSVDLRRYHATGETAHNPPLRDGDAVYVPPLEPHDVITVERTRRGPLATLDFRPGDTLTDVLLAAGGEALLRQYPTVRLVRADANGRLRSQTLDLAAITDGRAEPPPLAPRDRVLLVEPEPATALVEGYVRFPGSYPIVEGETTLRDLLEAAGGVRPDGLLRGAYLERRSPTPNGEADLLAAADPLQRALRDRLAFEAARLSDLPFGSRVYLARELEAFQRVSLALEDDAADVPPIPLRDGDRLVVPRDPGAVLVVGQVRHPGYVPLHEGADAAYYVAAAGGRGPAATAVYVREAGSGLLRPADGAPLRSGDTVFVDRVLVADTETLQSLTLQERQLSLQQQQEVRNRRVQLAQIALSALTTAATLVTTYLLILDRN